MNLYNMLHGVNPGADQLLGLLGLTKHNFERFRDIYIEDSNIVVHTRCGGGNREAFEDVFDMSAGHPWYSHNTDCDFDCTYADIYFKIPEKYIETYAALAGPGKKPADAWHDTFRAMGAKSD